MNARSTGHEISAVFDTSTMTQMLWDKASHNLSTGDLEWFTRANEYALQQSNNLQKVLEGVGCLIGSDERSGALQDKGSISTLLFSISAQLDTINGLMWLGGAAQDVLKYPELFTHKP